MRTTARASVRGALVPAGWKTIIGMPHPLNIKCGFVGQLPVVSGEPEARDPRTTS